MAEQNREFLNRVTIEEIYGRYTVRPGTILKIPWETYIRLGFEAGEEVNKTTKKDLMQQHGIGSIRSWGAGGLESPHITPGPMPELAWWAPVKPERDIILGIAKAVSERGKPFILDAACGAGFVSRLLAAEEAVKVLGIDVDPNSLGRAPLTSGDYSLRQQNIWDVIPEFGPSYPTEIAEEVKRRLNDVRRTQDYDKKLDIRNSSDDDITQYRRNYILTKRAIRKLQEIVPQTETDSQVDIVVCSFMQKYLDLTVPIRDGIHPRVMIYIREIGGNTGLDWPGRNDLTESFIRKNRVVSFDPGDQYITTARWRTFCKNDWEAYAYGYDTSLKLGAEVVVQLRRDVQLHGLPLVDTSTYPWEREYVDLLTDCGRIGDFYSGLENAKTTLLNIKGGLRES